MKKFLIAALTFVLTVAMAVPVFADSVVFNEATNDYTVTAEGLTANSQYIMLVLSGTKINAETIKYIDQAAANGSGKLTFSNFIPSKYPGAENQYGVYVSGGTTGGPKLIGYLPKAKGFSVSGTAVSWNDTDNANYYLYPATMTDQEIRADVKLTEPQNALYKADKKAITANADGKRYDQQYDFSAVAEGSYKIAMQKPGKYIIKIVNVEVTESIDMGEQKMWLYGDVNYNGKVQANDGTQITRYVNSKSSVFGSTSDAQTEADRLIAGDVNNNGKVQANDGTQITRHVNSKTSVFDNMD